MRALLPLLCVPLAVGFAAGLRGAEPPPEVGRPLVRVYSPAEIGATDEVRCAVQDARGIMLFGTRGAVLEFDGETWRRLPVPTTGLVHALAATSDGAVWVLADGELGRFQPTAAGGRHYASLRALAPLAPGETFSTQHALAAAGDQVWVALGGALARWTGAGFARYPHPTPNPSRLFTVAAGKLIAHVGNGDVLQLSDGAPEPIANAPDIAMAVAWLSPHRGTGRWLLAEVRGPLGVVQASDAAGQLAPLTARLSRIESGVVLPGGGYAFLPDRGGVALLDADLRLRAEAGAIDGVPTARAHSLYADRDGGVWVCAARGVVRIDDRTPVTLFDESQGLARASLPAPPTAPRAIAARPAGAAAPDMLQPFPLLTSLVHLPYRAIRHDGRLLVAFTNGGVLAYDPEQRRFAAASDLSASEEIVATPAGLLVQEKGGRRLYVAGDPPLELGPGKLLHGMPTGAGADSFSIATTENIVRFTRTAQGWRHTAVAHGVALKGGRADAESPDVWWLSGGDSLVRIRLDGSSVAASENQAAALGLPPRELHALTRIGRDWVALTTAGLKSFDAAARRFIPYNRLGADLADGRHTMQRIVAEESGRVWCIVQPAGRAAEPAVLAIEADGRRHELPRDVRLRLGRIQSLDLDADAAGGPVLWVFGSDSLARIELARWGASRSPTVIPVNLRAAQIVGGEPLPLAGPPPPLPQAARTLRVSYAAAHFPLSGRVEYQTRLEGLEPEWSDWQPAATREFTHLPVGHYTLRVRARRDDAAGEAAPYAVSIVPPWWRTHVALAAWILLAGGGVLGFLRWRLGALRRRAASLERVVDARTAELRASEEQLRVARDAAEAANRAKSAFLAHMSHELRTPLNGILGYAQVLRRDPAQPPPARERLGVIVDSGEHLLALINEVLDLAKVEAGKMELRPADTSLDRLARGVADLMRARCEEKGLAFALEIAPGLPRLVRTDEQKLRQSLLNLLGNAVKFTERGSVRLTVAPTADGRVRFLVADTGPGIPAERQRTMFTAFDSTAAHGGQGTGLGLALSQRMVELLGGRIQMQSAPGAGSRFWFDLPLPEVGSGQPFEGGAGARSVAGYAGPRLRLLIVDDDATNRAVLRDLLAPLGFAIDEAQDAAQALAAAHARPPAAVLLDLRFTGGADGFALARDLRRDTALDSAKLIVVSASAFETDRHQALAAGCDAFLAKPFKEEQLFAVLGAQLELRWSYRAAPAEAAGAGRGTGTLPEEEMGSLRALVRSGDLRGLRRRLAALQEEHPAETAWLRQLDELAAAFELKRLRELLGDTVPVA